MDVFCGEWGYGGGGGGGLGVRAINDKTMFIIKYRIIQINGENNQNHANSRNRKAERASELISGGRGDGD